MSLELDDIILDEMQEELVKYNLLASNRGSPYCMKPLKAREGFRLVSSDLCLHPDCEYLTPEGWLKVSEIRPHIPVLQVDKTSLKGNFTLPLRIIDREYSGKMIEYNSVRGGICVTEGHTMLHVGQQTHKRVDKALWRGVFLAGETPKNKGGNWCHFTYSDEFLGNEIYSEEDIWRVCALQADSYLSKRGFYIIQVIKERKIEKLNSLFENGRTVVRKDNGKHIRVYRNKFEHPLISGKNINIEKLHPSQIPVFIEALEFFDGCPSSRTTYGRIIGWTSTNIELCNKLQAYFVRNGYECRLNYKKRSTENHSDFCTLSIKKMGTTRSYSSKLGSHTEEIVSQYSGRVYCVTVPSGFILVRYHGQTFVVGNCSGEPTLILNYSNDATLYTILYGMRGKKPYWHNGLLLTDSLYITTLSGTDLLNPLLTNSFIESYFLDSEKAKQEKEFKRKYKISKIIVLASLYGALPGNPYKNTGLFNILKKANNELPLKEVRELWKAFWGSLPDVAKFRDSMSAFAESCKKDNKPFINGFGFLIPSSDPHKAFNYTIQSSLSCWVRHFLHIMKLKGGINWSTSSLVGVVHDEIICEVKEEFLAEYERILNEAKNETNAYFKLRYPLELGFSVGDNFYEIH